jgi:hypothetical protein
LHLADGKAIVQEQQNVGVKPLLAALGLAVGMQEFLPVRVNPPALLHDSLSKPSSDGGVLRP